MGLSLGVGLSLVADPGPLSLRVGLVAYYRLSDATDSSGNGYTLTESGAAHGTGKIGNALTSGTANTGLQSVPYTDLTLSFWFKFVSFAFAESGIQRLSRVEEEGAALAATLERDGTSITVGGLSSAGLSTNTWHHALLTLSGGAQSLYVNGSLVGTEAGAAAGTLTNWQAQAGTRIQVDEWAFWTRALTTAEIAAIYNAGAGFDPTA